MRERFNTQCKVFVLLEVAGTSFKPHSALSIKQCHGLWAHEDSPREGDGGAELCFGAFFFSWEVMVFMGIQCGFRHRAHGAHAVHARG